MQPETLKQNTWLALFFLFTVSFFNYLDRFVLSVLQPAIKLDLDLTDTQLGAIAAAFTVSYVILGIPFARLADKYSRKLIVSVSLAIWSAMTAASGLAQNFMQLAAARTLVGVGEAGATPPCHSLISDYFPPEKRAKALSIFGLGAPIGIMVGFVLASWLVQDYSWRVAFISLGLPGLVFALIFYAVLKEPRRGATTDKAQATLADEPLSFLASIKIILSSATYRNTAIATGLYTVVYLGVVQWLPSYFIRSFELPLTEVGLWLAMSLGVSQLIGMLLSGVTTDLLTQKDARWYCWIPALAMGLSTPLFAVVFATDNSILAAVALFPAFMIGIFQGPASFATIQRVADVRVRATAVAVFLLITNIIGGALGPLFTGWLSDYFTAEYGNESLRWALLIVAVLFGFWSCFHYALAARSIRDDIEA